ncbi:MAG: glycoside hydrolase family 44 protein [Myxococcota bacterium]
MASDLMAGDPPERSKRTSVPMTAQEIEAWVREIRKRDAELNVRSVDNYILGNEPMLWHSTHRDVHPEPLGYDELLKRTIDYGSAVRRADPDAVISGPSVWGWPAYFFSAIDGKAGFSAKPDRRKHGDTPLLEWYLQKTSSARKANRCTRA